MIDFSLFQNFPRLDIGSRAGDTDYIDFLQVDEVTHPVMIGVDRFNRPFIVAKYKVEGADTIIMDTYFQRFSNDTRVWHCCGHATRLLLETCGGMSEIQGEFITKLLLNGSHTILDKHRPRQGLYVDKEISLVKK